MHEAEFLRCLIECDVQGIRRLWRHVSPHLPQPKDDDEALYTIHLARTQAKLVPLRLKRYSEHWLKEYGYRVVTGVGIAVKSLSPASQNKADDVRAAMSEAVLDAVKAGIDLRTETDEVKRRMLAARLKHAGL